MEYGKAWEFQRDLFRARSQNEIIDTFLILQHPPTYTFGRCSQGGRSILSEEKIPLNPPLLKGESSLTPPFRKGGMGGFDRSLSGEDIEHADIYWVDRGGGATYHGPGQIVGYPIIGLKDYTTDLHAYLRMLEEVMMGTLKGFQIESQRLKGYTGVWVEGEKIGSIGVRVIRGVTMHGFSLNVNNDLAPFDKIVPCNIRGVRMTSMSRILRSELIMSEVEEGVTDHFARVFDVKMERVSNPLQPCLV
ncbi:MAG: lipoyl(octanoyl) transferase LipB [Nitrospirae bacterium]|nr:lipoyl(octanoyl) transferase LipB [Nitrospirota bacterium]